jgi:hypothetical protein
MNKVLKKKSTVISFSPHPYFTLYDGEQWEIRSGSEKNNG